MRSTTLHQRIVVLLDGTPSGERGLAWVRQLARGSGSLVHLVLIRPPGAAVRDGSRVLAFADQVEDGARAAALAYLEPAAARLREDGLAVMTHVRIGKPVETTYAAIAEMSADIVVASGIDAGDLRRVLRHAPVPVLVTGPECRRSA
ncbi:MAG TPA: universal stress protein [Methylomirabilota bacterium]|nr:universal stress protein [Methylomirabilota bacterium]